VIAGDVKCITLDASSTKWHMVWAHEVAALQLRCSDQLSSKQDGTGPLTRLYRPGMWTETMTWGCDVGFQWERQGRGRSHTYIASQSPVSNVCESSVNIV
jgi:hypothetical protein